LGAYAQREKEKGRRWGWRYRESESLKRTAELTKGIKNHFWLEKEFINEGGHREELTERIRDIFLQNLTQIVNLDQLEREWPFVNWFKIIKQYISFETLRPHLNKFELPKPLLREALPITSEIRLDPVCLPYLKSNLGHAWPPGLGGATILQNLYLVIGSCARQVKWESDVIFQID